MVPGRHARVISEHRDNEDQYMDKAMYVIFGESLGYEALSQLMSSRRQISRFSVFSNGHHLQAIWWKRDIVSEW